MLIIRLELTRRLKHKKSAQMKDGVEQFSSDSSSSDSDSDSRSSSSSSSSSDSAEEEEEVNGVNDFPVITDALEQQAKLAETVSC